MITFQIFVVVVGAAVPCIFVYSLHFASVYQRICIYHRFGISYRRHISVATISGKIYSSVGKLLRRLLILVRMCVCVCISAAHPSPLRFSSSIVSRFCVCDIPHVVYIYKFNFNIFVHRDEIPNSSNSIRNSIRN